jgi:hypothetical protein
LDKALAGLTSLDAPSYNKYIIVHRKILLSNPGQQKDNTPAPGMQARANDVHMYATGCQLVFNDFAKAKRIRNHMRQMLYRQEQLIAWHVHMAIEYV